MATEADLLPIGEAARRVPCSPTTLRKLVREGALPTYRRPLDRRERLVRVGDLETLRTPRRAETEGVPPMAG